MGMRNLDPGPLAFYSSEQSLAIFDRSEPNSVMHSRSATTDHDTGGKFEPTGRGIHSEFVFLGYDFLPLAPRFTQHPLFPVDEITSGGSGGCVVLLFGLLQVPEEGLGDLL